MPVCALWGMRAACSVFSRQLLAALTQVYVDVRCVRAVASGFRHKDGQQQVWVRIGCDLLLPSQPTGSGSSAGNYVLQMGCGALLGVLFRLGKLRGANWVRIGRGVPTCLVRLGASMSGRKCWVCQSGGHWGSSGSSSTSSRWSRALEIRQQQLGVRIRPGGLVRLGSGTD